MRKETRANLIFIGVLLAVTLPGGVILFKKKLDPAVPPMYLPEQARVRLPYLSPTDAPDLERYVPERTGQWVNGVAESLGLGRVMLREGLPVVSRGRSVQVAAVGSEGAGTWAWLILWWDDLNDAGDLTMTADRGEVRVEQFSPGEVPTDVRKELIYAGYAQPPKRAVWVKVGIASDRPGMLRVRFNGRDESVPVFTK